MASETIEYQATRTLARFHNDNSFFRVVFGPVGSGKTVGAIPAELFRRMCTQTPDSRGVRHTRWLVVRGSYPQLVSTVIPTFMQWTGFLGKLTMGSPIQWEAKFSLPDGTTVNTLIWFKPLSSAQDIQSLRSLNVTGAAMSECAELGRDAIDMLRTRIRRYPDHDGGPSWFGLWGESNPPSMESHWYRTFEEDRPSSHRVFHQPAPLIYDTDAAERIAMSRPAEIFNPANLPADLIRQVYLPSPEAENIRAEMGGYDYYYNQIPGSAPEFIDVFIMGNYGAVHSGVPVYPEWDRRRHRASDTMRPEMTQVVAGIDFGLNPAAVFTQVSALGALHVLGEVADENVGFEEFLDEQLVPYVRHRFPRQKVLFVGDPSSNRRESLSKANAYRMMSARGLAVQPALSNDPEIREAAVKHFLRRHNAFYLDPSCTVLEGGFAGGYRRREIRNQSSPRGAVKDRFSHPHDALQYAALHWYRGSMLSQPHRAVRSAPPRRYLYA